MTYQTRPGVTAVNVCGVVMLVPTRAAFDSCRAVTALSFFQAIVWSMLQKGKSLEEIAGTFRILNKKPVEENLQTVRSLCEELTTKGYLIRRDDPTPQPQTPSA